ncbi:MAG TPA: isoprenylcysteine carboxylmethyltransferase family protein [Candidatus Limnocylindria bacterium]|jgi:protein-S-isoprenylcysteine O-methyltransferase Ste14|nr:isoprenylcysteine carboxylmethyltransferase family protein [Candidatus Limnocylindria bacterium]
MLFRAIVSVLPGVAAVLVPWLLLRQSLELTYLTWLGLVPIAFGLALFVWCVAIFAGRGRGTLAPWDPPRRFVATGPYRVVRNPMYLGVGSIIVGESVAFGSWALAVYLAVIATLWHLFVVAYEEPALDRQFGEEYRAYRSRVPRWLPNLGGGGRP